MSAKDLWWQTIIPIANRFVVVSFLHSSAFSAYCGPDSYLGNGLARVEHLGLNRNVHNLSRMGMMRHHPSLSEAKRQEKERIDAVAQQAIEAALAEQPREKPKGYVSL
jgi:hypothetical protein